ncbi:hypothetical protein FOXYSP1_04115 [Fusarium oxysporum f. sp. phaseoli]
MTARARSAGVTHTRARLYPRANSSTTSTRASSLTSMITEGLAAADARPVSQMIFGMIHQSSSRGRFMVCAQRIRCWRKRSKTSNYGSSPQRTIPPDSEPLLENIAPRRPCTLTINQFTDESSPVPKPEPARS